MLLGLLFALGACLLWGTIFVIPQFLPEFSSIEVALGRYFMFGLFSLLLLKKIGPYPLRTWGLAFSFGLLANILYYIGVVTGLRFATPPVTVLVVGMCPVFAALYSNWQTREFKFLALLTPCLVMMAGIVLVNVTEIDWSFSRSSLKEYLLGMGGALVGMVTWGWYAVQNARFLKKNPEMPRADWTTMIGVTTLFWVVLLASIFSLGPTPPIDLHKFTTPTSSLWKFFLLTAFLGVACAWVGGYLWNRACTLLPMALMGPFIIFETLFGLFFVFLYDFRFPTVIELAGIIAMLSGILLCHSLHQKKARLSFSKEPAIKKE